jgi:hypothetical protein
VVVSVECPRETRYVLTDPEGLKPRPLEWDAHEEEDLMERFQVMPVVRLTSLRG